MRLGLGTGSTVQFALEALAKRVHAGDDLVGVPTSKRTENECRRLGIPLTTLHETPRLDLTIDGADEIDPQLNLVKGGGGALLREKVVAAASRRFIVVADERKLVPALGKTFAVPVEVVAFAATTVQHRLEAMDARVTPRKADNGSTYVTDNGMHILDAQFPNGIANVPQMEARIKMIPGVAEVGLFCGLASRAVVATSQGLRVVEGQTAPPANKPL